MHPLRLALVFLVSLYFQSLSGCAANRRPQPPKSGPSRQPLEQLLTATALKPIEGTRRELYRRMVEQTGRPSAELWHTYGAYQFQLRSVTGYRHPLLIRRASSDATETVAIDLNSLLSSAFDAELVSIQIEQSGEQVGYIIEGTNGHRALFVRDINLDKLYASDLSSPDQFVWGDANTIFVTTKTKDRPDRAYLFDLLTGTTTQQYFEPSADRYLQLQDADRGRAVLYSSSLDSSSVYILSRATPAIHPISIDKDTISLIKLLPDGYVALQKPSSGAERLELYRNSQLSPVTTRLIPKTGTVDSLEIRDGYVLLLGRENCRSALTVFDLQLNQLNKRIVGQETCGTLRLVKEGTGASLKALYSDLTTVETPIEIDLPKMRFKSPDSNKSLAQEILFALSDDGAEIPISIAYSATARNNGPMPTLLTGYAAYGESFNTSFTKERLVLLEQGVAYAVCHARGGGEYGRSWHEMGRGLNKRKSFEDYLACARKLKDARIADPQRLFGYGRSAGGLLVAGSLLADPTIFKAVVLEAPFLDVLGVSSDKDSPHHDRELTEWGDPAKPNELQAILSYSPLTTIHRTHYPAVLLIHSQADQLVSFQQSLAWIEKLREANLSAADLLIEDRFGGKHEHANDYYDDLEKSAEIYAFLLAS